MIFDLIDVKKLSEPTFEVVSTYKETNSVLVKEIRISSTNTNDINAFLVQPKETSNQPGMLFVHWLETHAQTSNKTEFLETAISLAEDGYVSLLPDAFWSTTPEKFKENPKMWWKTDFEHDKELNVNQIKELVVAYNLLKNLPYVDEQRIGYWGHDFGAMFGTLLVNFFPEIKVYVLMTPTGKFSDWYRFGNSIEDIKDLLDYNEKMELFNPVTHVSKIKTPILFSFSLNDFYVPVEKAFELYELAANPKEIKFYKTGHGMNEQAFNESKEWLKDQF